MLAVKPVVFGQQTSNVLSDFLSASRAKRAFFNKSVTRSRSELSA